MRGTPEWNSYMGARGRCNCKSNSSYTYYGAKGVQFKFKEFREFVDEVGLKPAPEYSIDRINPFGHYESGNVRWATPQEQAANTRSKSFVA